MGRTIRLPERLSTEARRELQRDLVGYASYVHGYEPAPFQSEWADALMDIRRGRTVIVAPPESGKTAWCTAFAAWSIGNDPAIHIGYIANTHRQAARQSVAVREIIRSNLRYKHIFPHVELDEVRGTGEAEWFVKRENQSDKDATFQVSGHPGPILGARLDVVIVDDYSDKENSQSPVQREKAWEWFRENVLTRLNPDNGRLICIQTRWAEDDLAGCLIKAGAELLEYPAVRDGESLWPEKWTTEGLESRRRELGPRIFDLQYQGVVRPAEGNIFHREWWRYSSAAEPLPSPNLIVLSLDTAFKTGQDRDYSVATVWALCKNGHYLLYMWRDRVEFPQLVKEVVRLHKVWKAKYVLIEDSGSGQSLIQHLKQESRLPVVPVKAIGDKQERAIAITPLVETGKVFLPKEAAWREDVEYELEVFPRGSHDDIVDSVVQYLAWARDRKTSKGVDRQR